MGRRQIRGGNVTGLTYACLNSILESAYASNLIEFQSVAMNSHNKNISIPYPEPKTAKKGYMAPKIVYLSSRLTEGGKLMVVGSEQMFMFNMVSFGPS